MDRFLCYRLKAAYRYLLLDNFLKEIAAVYFFPLVQISAILSYYTYSRVSSNIDFSREIPRSTEKIKKSFGGQVIYFFSGHVTCTTISNIWSSNHKKAEAYWTQVREVEVTKYFWKIVRDSKKHSRPWKSRALQNFEGTKNSTYVWAKKKKEVERLKVTHVRFHNY